MQTVLKRWTVCREYGWREGCPSDWQIVAEFATTLAADDFVRACRAITDTAEYGIYDPGDEPSPEIIEAGIASIPETARTRREGAWIWSQLGKSWFYSAKPELYASWDVYGRSSHLAGAYE